MKRKKRKNANTNLFDVRYCGICIDNNKICQLTMDK